MPEPNATPAPLTDRSPNDDSLRGTLEVLDEYQRLTCDMDDPPPFPCSTRKVVELVESLIATRAKLAEAEEMRDHFRGCYEGLDVVLTEYRIDCTKLTAAESRVAALTEACTLGNRRLGYWCDLHGSLPEDRAALSAMQAALSPSQDAKGVRDA